MVFDPTRYELCWNSNGNSAQTKRIGCIPENNPDAQFSQRLKSALEYVPAEQGWQTKSSLAIEVLLVPVDHKTVPAPSMSIRFPSFCRKRWKGPDPDGLREPPSPVPVAQTGHDPVAQISYSTKFPSDCMIRYLLFGFAGN